MGPFVVVRSIETVQLLLHGANAVTVEWKMSRTRVLLYPHHYSDQISAYASHRHGNQYVGFFLPKYSSHFA